MLSWINQESCVQTEDMENDEGEAQEFLDTLKENMNENEGCIIVKTNLVLYIEIIY